jgi:hypothetical protein
MPYKLSNSKKKLEDFVIVDITFDVVQESSINELCQL